MLVQSRESEVLKLFKQFSQNNTRSATLQPRPRQMSFIPSPNKLPRGSKEGVYCHFCKKLLRFEGRRYQTQKCETHNNLIGGEYILPSCESCATLYMAKKNGSWICALCVRQYKRDEKIYLESQLKQTFIKYAGIYLQPYIIDDLIDLIRQYIY